jgi:diguanylate cyclase (GGDEF)-like protein
VLAVLPGLTGLIFSAVLWIANGPLVGSELLLVWCVFFAAYFLPRPAAWANSGVLAGSYAIVVLGRRGLSGGLPAALELTATVVIACALVSMLRHRAAASLHEARTEARTDPLTGLLNRRGLSEVTVREVARAQRDGKPLSLWMVDLDHFKGLNDSLGHAAGDRALQKTAEVLRAEMRAVDVLARVGGEEFCVVLSGCSTSNAFLRAEELRERIAEEFRLRELPVTVSIGVATWSPGDLDGNAMMVAADEALYAAKRSGRNNTQIAHGIPVGRRTSTEVR